MYAFKVKRKSWHYRIAHAAGWRQASYTMNGQRIGGTFC